MFLSSKVAVRLVAVFVLTLGATFAWQAQRQDASAYYWQWTGQPYLRDGYGNYSYRDMDFYWLPWQGNLSYVYFIETYVNIVAYDYHYDTAFFLYENVAGGNISPHAQSTYLDYDNTPLWVPDNKNPRLEGTVTKAFSVITAHCAYSLSCGTYSSFTNGAYLWAQVANQGTQGTCYERGQPSYQSGCY